MPKSAKKKTSPQEAPLICGVFTKREAAQKISAGVRHLHSTQLGDRDACARITAECLKTHKMLLYPWEQQKKVEDFLLHSSAERHPLTTRLIQSAQSTSKRDLRERLELTLEELLTNSLYHAYRNERGEEKYPRKSPVQLAPGETVNVRYSLSPEGIYLSLKDQGGTFSFETIAASFLRCYNEGSQTQIEGKQGGAGLGIYMVFEVATHFKVVCDPGKSTQISIWLSDRRGEGVENFSFNYFTGKV